MGVRLAVGAVPRDVLRLIVGDCLRFAVVGSVVGLVAVAVLGGRLAAFTPSWDGVGIAVPAAAALVVTALAILAAYFPARHATTVDPVVALRPE
jgi:putative ABC transport system permease protein